VSEGSCGEAGGVCTGETELECGGEAMQDETTCDFFSECTWDVATTGYSDTCTDSNTDGFCDLPYDIEDDEACTTGVNCSNNTDYLPLSDEYVPADTCTCPGLDTDWEIDMSDYCNITENCELGIGNITFINSGSMNCNATINCSNFGSPPNSSGTVYIESNCMINIG